MSREKRPERKREKNICEKTGGVLLSVGKAGFDIARGVLVGIGSVYQILRLIMDENYVKECNENRLARELYKRTKRERDNPPPHINIPDPIETRPPEPKKHVTFKLAPAPQPLRILGTPIISDYMPGAPLRKPHVEKLRSQHSQHTR